MRIFAGPNGSGKSTIINSVRNYRIKNRPIDFGIYINADDIAKILRDGKFSFEVYEIKTNNSEFQETALRSGLISNDFNKNIFTSSYRFYNNKIQLINKKADERLAQILADFIRKKLLLEKKKFSFETVFSHPSKLDIIQKAVEEGYKVYLYFVSTETPDINKYRVEVRAMQGGHNVDPQKIESRYYRSLELLYTASQFCYQTYFFDNSEDGKNFKLIAHFKKNKDKKTWDSIDTKRLPEWFVKYYLNKIKI